jgi:hypothetical protein
LYKQGFIEPFWGDKHKDLRYTREPFNNQSDLDKWRSQGYTQDFFTGEMFDMKSSMPEWTTPFFSLFKGSNVGLSFYKMNTCNILPRHQDTYEYYKKIFTIKDTRTIWRAIIFLEDWKLGHVFEIQDDPITKWRAGEYVLWQYDSPHMAANLGIDPRYTAQITFTDV